MKSVFFQFSNLFGCVGYEWYHLRADERQYGNFLNWGFFYTYSTYLQIYIDNIRLCRVDTSVEPEATTGPAVLAFSPSTVIAASPSAPSLMGC